jgi:hypothetical protein
MHADSVAARDGKRPPGTLDAPSVYPDERMKQPSITEIPTKMKKAASGAALGGAQI